MFFYVLFWSVFPICLLNFSQAQNYYSSKLDYLNHTNRKYTSLEIFSMYFIPMSAIMGRFM